MLGFHSGSRAWWKHLILIHFLARIPNFELCDLFMELVRAAWRSPLDTAHLNIVKQLLVRNWTWEEATKKKHKISIKT